MASKIGVGLAQQRGVGREPAGDGEPGDGGDAGRDTLGRAGLDPAGAVDEGLRIAAGRGQDQGREPGGAGKARRIVDGPGDIAVEMQRVAPDEAALAPYLPDLAQQPARKALAAGAPTEDDDFAAEKRGAGREFDDGLCVSRAPS